METQTHTQGPWKVEAVNGKLGEEPGLYLQANGQPLFRGDFCRSEADANLIAAAPELLAVMRDVAALLPCAGRLHPSDLFKLQTRVTDVLAKADGL